MGRTLDAIPDHLARWAEGQPLFFVATAPLAADGHVNLSRRQGADGIAEYQAARNQQSIDGLPALAPT